MSSGKSYDQPLVVSYGLGLHDYGTAGDALSIPVPFGKTRFRVEDIIVMAAGAEDFDTGGKVELGTAADPNHYAELDIGVLVDTDSKSISDPDAELFDIGHGGKGIADIGQEGITQIEVLLTTSTSTGFGYTTIVIGWW